MSSSVGKTNSGSAKTIDADAVIAKERSFIAESYGQQFDVRFEEYLQTDYRDFINNGYPEYVAANYTWIDPNDYPHPERPWYGLAISGGGIRSASFAIGVIQGLNNKNLFEENTPKAFDKLTYLSTSSGGGYAGSALSWYLTKYNLFPFGNTDTFAGSQYSDKPEDKILSYIRQHGKYLTPAKLKLPSLIGSVLMSVLHSVVAYTIVFSVMMLILNAVASWEIVIDLLQFRPVDETTVQALLSAIPQNISQMQDEVVGPTKIAFSTLFLFIAFSLSLIFIAVVFIYGLSTVFGAIFSKAYCYRIQIQALLGTLLKLLGLSLFLAALPITVIFIFGADFQLGEPGSLTSLISGIAGISAAIKLFRQKMESSSSEPSTLSNVVTAAALLLFVFFIFLIAYMVGESAYLAINPGNFLLSVVLIIAALIIPLAVNINEISPHKMYRDRLMETFLKAPETPESTSLCEIGDVANSSKLCDVQPSNTWSPYHLICCNIILNNAKNPRVRGRMGDSFILSPFHSGSTSTSYVATDKFNGGKLTLATAMSISGAAANPHTGVDGKGSSANPLVSLLMTFLGLRLGYWSYSPRASLLNLHRIMRPNYVSPGFNSLLNFGHDEQSMFVELSDGGHFDNTGIYELIRRRTPVIILSDGSADPDFTFEDFGNAIERVRVDFGVSIRFPDARYDLAGLLPGSKQSADKGDSELYDEKFGLAERGFAIGDIVYPDAAGQKAFVGNFIYMKATLTRNLPGDLYAYKASNPTYPDQPTLDQFFEERQFEAYRELGYQLTRQLMKDKAASKKLP